jgi:hypothetical protein
MKKKDRAQFNVWIAADLALWVKEHCSKNRFYIGEFVEKLLREEREKHP